MKKTWFLVMLLLVIFVSGCSLGKKTQSLTNTDQPQNPELTTCSVPSTISTSTATSTRQNILPPVSQEEIKKTFTYEDEEMGVKLKYPGSCFFNKGIFQCSDFTMSIWILDGTTTPNDKPEISFKDGQTQVKYTFIHKNKVYALMAWYDGRNKNDLEKVIDKISKSLTFTR